jgi:acetamidase/formamidase
MAEIPVLEPDARTLHGWFDRGLEPVLTVDPGTTVRFRTLDSGWSAGPWTGERRRVPEWREGCAHALTGPVEIRGARPGMVLEVRIDAVVPGSWGTTYAGVRSTAWTARLGIDTPAVHAWEIDATAGTARNQHGHTVAVRPFLGVIGMPPPEPGRHSTVPPYWHGGNLDCRELVAGSTLYLPIPVEGGLLSVGDGHAAQGDGEVSGTAIECPSRAQLTLDVRDDLALDWPCARSDGAWLTFGFDQDLTAAAWKANEGMLDLLEREHALDRREALALASVVVDLRVTQLVNGVLGVHAVLRDDAVL